jgi:hypothetical protein
MFKLSLTTIGSKLDVASGVSLLRFCELYKYLNLKLGGGLNSDIFTQSCITKIHNPLP